MFLEQLHALNFITPLFHNIKSLHKPFKIFGPCTNRLICLKIVTECAVNDLLRIHKIGLIKKEILAQHWNHFKTRIMFCVCVFMWYETKNIVLKAKKYSYPNFL